MTMLTRWIFQEIMECQPHVAYLDSYLDDDYLRDFRANSSQQGENDGGPSILASHDPKGIQGGPNSQF